MTRIFLDLEAGPPPMTEAEKLEALPDSKRPKEPKEPVLKQVAGNIKKPTTIAEHEAKHRKAYGIARNDWLGECLEHDAAVTAAAEQHWRDLAKNPEKAIINTIGWSHEGEARQISGDDVEALVLQFANALPDYAHAIDWVTANGNHYDLHLLHVSVCRLLHKYVREGIHDRAQMMRRLRDAIPWTLHRGGTSRSVDLMGRGMPKRGRSFGAICEAYLGEGKQGSEDPVGDYLDPERRHLLLERNCRDVDLLVMLDEVLR